MCTLVAAGQLNTVEAATPRDGYIKLVPVLGSGVSPGHSVLRLDLEAEVVVAAELEEALPILVHPMPW